DPLVTGVQTCALPISATRRSALFAPASPPAPCTPMGPTARARRSGGTAAAPGGDPVGATERADRLRGNSTGRRRARPRTPARPQIGRASCRERGVDGG